ncbi:MAG: hypothetical protein FD143_779 [Ignavibacteria bacterium]|nr:MAG: hypothetical protein FD143_779 [Ignavibacteria bacterium]KAF0161392.1 MAG: hypothetical protein FD188_980 [Ignavibacteria bacterium]
MKNNKTNFEKSRRDFLKKTSAGLIGAALLGNIPVSLANSFSPFETLKSKVVLVRHSKVVDQEGNVNLEILAEMLETALTSFNNGKNSADLWNKLFIPKDIIGIKVNLLGLNSIAGSSSVKHYAAMIDTVLRSAGNAGLISENFIVWDRNNDEFNGSGLRIQKEIGKTKYYGTLATKNDDIDAVFSAEVKAGEKFTRISKILTESCTALINMPVIKDHGLAGITGALKNHYGTINNPRDFHSNNCTTPGIPEINALHQIRSKQKLIIVDALIALFNGGPRWNRDYMWNYGGILVSTDPVAIDRIMFGIINEKRQAEGMNLISENTAKHINLSAGLKLGTDVLSEIDFQKIELG